MNTRFLSFFCLIFYYTVSSAQVVIENTHFDYYQNTSDNDFVNRFSGGYGLSQIETEGITGGSLITPDSISWGNDNAIYCSRYHPLTGDTIVTALSFKYDSSKVKLISYQRAMSIWLIPSADFNHYIVATVSGDKKIELLTYGWNNNPYPLLALHSNHWYNYKLTIVFNTIDQLTIKAEVFDLGLSGMDAAVLVNSSGGTITDNVLGSDTSILVSITGTTYGGSSHLDDFSFHGRKGQSNCINIATNITATVPEEKINLFPTPATDEAVIEISGASNGVVEIFSLTGEKITTVSIASPRTYLDLHEFTSGIYFVRFLSDGHSAISKLVVSN